MNQFAYQQIQYFQNQSLQNSYNRQPSLFNSNIETLPQPQQNNQLYFSNQPHTQQSLQFQKQIH
jgi:hypothetical protein